MKHDRPPKKRVEINEAGLPRIPVKFSEIPLVEVEPILRSDKNVIGSVEFLIGDCPAKLSIRRSAEQGDIDTPNIQENGLRETFDITLEATQGNTIINLYIEASLQPEESGYIGTTITRDQRFHEKVDPAIAKNLPPGTGLALYAKMMDELLPAIAAEFPVDMTHSVGMMLDEEAYEKEDHAAYLAMGKKKYETKWRDQFVPLLNARNYEARGSELPIEEYDDNRYWTKAYPGKKLGIQWPNLIT